MEGDIIHRQVHTDLTNDELEARWTIEGGQDGFYLYTPKTYHILLTVILWISLAVIMVPATFLFKAATSSLAPLVAPQFAVAALLLAQAIAKSSIQESINHIDYIMTHHGLQYVTRFLTAVAFGFSTLALVLSITGYLGCATRSSQTLLQLVGNTNNVSMLEFYHTPEFAKELAWEQMCADDLLLTLGFMVVVSVILVLDFLIYVHESTLEGRTADMHKLLSEAKRIITERDADRPGTKGPTRHNPVFDKHEQRM